MRFNYLSNTQLKKLSGDVKRASILLFALLLLSACSSFPVDRGGERLPGHPKRLEAESAAQGAEPDVASPNAGQEQDLEASPKSENAIYPGTGRFVKAQTNSKPQQPSEQGDVTLNFENTDLREVANIILGDLLKVNYVIDPAVRGGVSMQTGRPLSRELLLPTLETLLRMNGATLVIDSGGMHHVVPLAKAAKGMLTPQLTDAVAALPSGYSIQVVPLRYVAATEMANILEPIASQGNIIRVDSRRNLLLLAGDQQELGYLLQTIETFDVDWLAGLSVGFFALENAKVDDVMKGLNSILEGETGAMLDGLVKVVPVPSANGLLAVTPRPHYLKEVEKWVARLDKLSANDAVDERLYVYRVQNGDAENLAKLLNELLKNGSSKEKKSATVAPGLKAKQASTDKKGTKGVAKSSAASASSNSAGQNSISQIGSDVRIVADTEKNSLLILATARDYNKLQALLESLDIVPLQVHIEATIVEVTLSGDLQYGLQWYFKTSHGSKHGFGGLDGSLDSSTSSGLGTFFPGFNWSIVDSADKVRTVLSAFSGDTVVNVLSAPSVMVLDNHEATIQVGDQVPVATQQQQSTDANSTVINSIQYRDTGVMLMVKPRVTAGGLVTMEINQEVSSVSKTDSSNLDSPTIQTRKITSTVAINSGQSVVLGGLISEDESKGQSGIPGLYKLPVVGALFGETTNTSRRKELVVVLTPKVVADSQDAKRISADYRARLRSLSDVKFSTNLKP